MEMALDAKKPRISQNIRNFLLSEVDNELNKYSVTFWQFLMLYTNYFSRYKNCYITLNYKLQRAIKIFKTDEHCDLGTSHKFEIMKGTGIQFIFYYLSLFISG